ncbi:MAG TPA: nitrogen fixation protein NifW [Campylobacterales bacterium]|nr:nitrogen fixation protein NifW [Campylobacterales bacterium]HHC11066.1 nitrogen fixation protein NifW [Campylobacterales bacterium]
MKITVNSLDINDFYTLKNAEDYFNFFGIEYDEHLINVKRFHIMKEYGTLIRTGIKNIEQDNEKLIDFLKFSLLRVYGDFKNGYAPSAADVWGMFENEKLSGCASCTPTSSQGGNCAC